MKTNQQRITWVAAVLCLSLTSAAWAGGRVQLDSRQTLFLLAQTASPSQQQYMEQHSAPKSESDKNMTTTSSTKPTKCNKASDLIGTEVKNPQGEELGEIKDIVVDLNNGTVSYVVMGSGGIVGIHEKLLAVLPSAFTPSADHKHLILQADKSNVEQAKGIGANWPSVRDPSFGAEPFWQHDPAQTSGTQSGHPTKSWENNSTYNQETNTTKNPGHSSTNKW